MAEGKAVTKALAKSFKRYLKVHHHLDYCLKFNNRTLENRTIQDAYKRLKLAVQTKPTDGKLHTQVNTVCSDWTEDTVAVITEHFEGVLADFNFNTDTTNWEDAWAMAVNWVRKELVDFNMDVAVRAEVKVKGKLKGKRNQLAEDIALFTRRRHLREKLENRKLSIQRPILIRGASRLPKCNARDGEQAKWELDALKVTKDRLPKGIYCVYNP